MAKSSQVCKVVEFLQQHPRQQFTARQIAEAIVAAYPDDYRVKRENPRFSSDSEFLDQVVAEIGAQKASIIKCNSILYRDKPRPRVYWHDPDLASSEPAAVNGIDDSDDELKSDENLVLDRGKNWREADLYQILINYLKSEKNLYCQRIDEKRSRNQRGKGGNQWLHPDIVALQPLDKAWNDLVRTCADKARSIRLWSFEVKTELTLANVRKSFFQAVSNSSWANEGYLVAAAIADNQVEQELQMLSALHGIGFILLDPTNPTESEFLLPARARTEVDWQSVNRLLLENDDFKDYIELVSMYHQTGRLRAGDWNKITHSNSKL